MAARAVPRATPWMWIGLISALVFFVGGFTLVADTKWALVLIGGGSVCLVVVMLRRLRDLKPDRTR